jgi:predicted nucleotidyltransferase
MFGSRLTGNIHPESDTDIAVYGRKIFSETERVLADI